MASITSATLDLVPFTMSSSPVRSFSRSSTLTPIHFRYCSRERSLKAWTVDDPSLGPTARSSRFILRSKAFARGLSGRSGPSAKRNFSKFTYYFATSLDKAQAISNNSGVPPMTAVADDCLTIAARLLGCSDIPTSGILPAEAPWIFREPRLSFFLEVSDAH